MRTAELSLVSNTTVSNRSIFNRLLRQTRLARFIFSCSFIALFVGFVFALGTRNLQAQSWKKGFFIGVSPILSGFEITTTTVTNTNYTDISTFDGVFTAEASDDPSLHGGLILAGGTTYSQADAISICESATVNSAYTDPYAGKGVTYEIDYFIPVIESSADDNSWYSPVSDVDTGYNSSEYNTDLCQRYFNFEEVTYDSDPSYATTTLVTVSRGTFSATELSNLSNRFLSPPSSRTETQEIQKTEDGVGLQLGYNLRDESDRISFHYYSWKKGENKVAAQLVFYDYLFPFGLSLGLGYGSYSLDTAMGKASQSGGGFNLALQLPLSKNISLKASFLKLGANLSVENSSSFTQSSVLATRTDSVVFGFGFFSQNGDEVYFTYQIYDLDDPRVEVSKTQTVSASGTAIEHKTIEIKSIDSLSINLEYKF